MKQKDVAVEAIPQTSTVSYYHVILRKTSYTYFKKPKRVQASREVKAMHAQRVCYFLRKDYLETWQPQDVLTLYYADL